MKYIVIGLGNLGRAIARDLTRIGHEVIGIDKAMRQVDLIKDDLAGALALDSTDKIALASLPWAETDAVFVTFGKDFGLSVQTTALLKSLDAPRLIVRAISSIHETVIRAIGVDEIITPEKDFSHLYTAQASLGERFLRWYKVTESEHLYKIKTPRLLVGQTVEEVDLERHFQLHLVAIERPQQQKNLIGLTQTVGQVIHASPQLTIEEGDTLLLFGRIEAVNKLTL